jgi:hypothetical protein
MKRAHALAAAVAVLICCACSNHERAASPGHPGEHACNLDAGHDDYVRGIAAEKLGRYSTAADVFTTAGNAYHLCATLSHTASDRLQARYDEAMALWAESDALRRSRDPRAHDIARRAEIEFSTIVADPEANIPNRFYGRPSKATLRDEARQHLRVLKAQLR